MKILDRLSLIGWKSMFLCIMKKIFFRFLGFRYGFGSWHASAPYECRPYKAEVVSLANGLQPSITVEIGCGLGEILSRVCGHKRLGFDVDPAVITAARQLYGQKCEFGVASIANIDAICQAVGESADLLIMVNWPHGLPWKEFSVNVLSLARALSIRHVLMDTIVPGTPGYAHYHSRGDLEILGDIVITHQAVDGVRQLHVVRVKLQ
jgi:hypothetical protein